VRHADKRLEAMPCQPQFLRGGPEDSQASAAEKGADRVDADVLLAVFRSEAFGRVRHGGLAGIVPDEAGARPDGSDGCNVDHGPAFALVDEIGDKMSGALDACQYCGFGIRGLVWPLRAAERTHMEDALHVHTEYLVEFILNNLQ